MNAHLKPHADLPVIPHFIGGAPATAHGETRLLPVLNPATGAPQAQVLAATPADVNHVVATALAALPAWAATPALVRARVLFRFKALLEQHADEIAALITAEHGKTLPDARGEVTRGLEVVEFACGIPHLIKGEMSPNVGTGIDSYSTHPPVGVCVGITPFNFPAMVPLWMFPVALACGNTFILKPSEKDPSAPQLLARLLKEAGLPDGVFNVLNGGREAVEGLLTHPDVGAVSFVGSTPVAELIYRTASAHGKRVQALGGAKNHMVVMPDADLEQVATALLGAAYGSAGERCMAISVAVAVGDAGDRLVEMLAPRARTLVVGPGTVANVEMGPLISAEHLAKVRGYVDSGVAEGATLVVDGRALQVAGHESGNFLGACLFDHVRPEMRIYREEVFGPVLCVVRVPDFASALALVNAHEFGNGAAIFTRDGEAARQFAEGVLAGMVGVNVPIPVPMAFHSFGGWKRSLFGPLHVHGPDGVRFYTKLKTVTARWPASLASATAPTAARVADKGSEFVMPTMK